jgi:hypothetical protein
MRVAILFPITGIAGAPLARAVPADLAVYGVCGDLLSVVVGAPSSLAIRRAAYLLAGLELRRLEALLAITATPFMHTGVVVPCQSRFRNWCRVPYRVPANGLFPDHITGENAGVLNRGQQKAMDAIYEEVKCRTVAGYLDPIDVQGIGRIHWNN